MFCYFFPTHNSHTKTSEKTKAFGKGLQKNSSLNLHGLPLQIGPTTQGVPRLLIVKNVVKWGAPCEWRKINGLHWGYHLVVLVVHSNQGSFNP